MSYLSSRLAFTQRCEIQRNANLASNDGWGNPLPPDWQTLAPDVPCRGWVAGHETATDKGTLSVVLEVHLAVSVGTDVQEGDRVASVTYRGATFQDGPLAVRAVLPRRDHLELVLGKAVQVPSRTRFEWRGDKLIERLRHAADEGTKDTVEAAADIARASHEWVNRTDQLEEEIKVERGGRRLLRPRWRFGTTEKRGFYGLFHEEGTTHEFARPFLRPAADISWPNLLKNIRRRFVR